MNKSRKFIESILFDDNPISSIKNNINEIINIIPEIKAMIGFKHRNPYHHLDVWEHTLLAISKNTKKDLKIRLVLLLHDIGKPFSYQEEGNIRHFKNHPKVSSEIAKNILKRLDYTDEEIYEICQLILLHDDPLTDVQIRKNKDLCITLYQIQYCDALAHNPNMLEKRIKYLNGLSNKLFLDSPKILEKSKKG